MAVASLSAAASELAALTGGAQVALDRSLTDQWFDMTVRPIGWTIPEAWDPIAGDYRARNGWIRLHTNVPRHREASLSVLRVDADRERAAEAVARWDRFDLENAVIQASGRVMQARLSLARTAALLVSGGFASPRHARSAPGPDELLDEILEDTHWGPAYRVAFPVKIDGRGPVWRHAAGPFRSGPALWPG